MWKCIFWSRERETHFVIENALFFNGFCNSYFDDVRYDGGGILAVPDMTEVGYAMLQKQFCNDFRKFVQNLLFL